jgi:uncharacterized membrane protein
MIDDASHDASQESAPAVLEANESTAFHIWLLITVSAGIIMAQDTWLSLRAPRLGTMDATASFTKVLVIHGLWFLVSLGFLLFSWKFRTTTAWKLHIVVAALACVWTIGVMVNAFADSETLRVSTWRCDAAPTESVVTEEFLDTCHLNNTTGSIRMGGDIFLWSLNDKNFFRWIVPGENLVTLQTRWPSQVAGIYLAVDEEDAPLTSGSAESVPGGTWSAGFDPQTQRDLNIFYVDTPSIQPEDHATPRPSGS